MIAAFSICLANGQIVVGAIHGSGGLVGGGKHNRDRIRREIARATIGKPLGICEPKPGHVRMYQAATAADAGESIEVDIRGARLVEEL